MGILAGAYDRGSQKDWLSCLAFQECSYGTEKEDERNGQRGGRERRTERVYTCIHASYILKIRAVFTEDSN